MIENAKNNNFCSIMIDRLSNVARKTWKTNARLNYKYYQEIMFII